MNIALKRLRSDDNGTFGEMILNGDRLCVTCEPPWRDNQHNISCIPAGTYHFQPHDSNEHPGVWIATDVPDRTGILIHEGNTIHDSKGCIIVGSTFGNIDKLPAVLNSRATLQMLRSTLPDFFTVTIVE